MKGGDPAAHGAVAQGLERDRLVPGAGLVLGSRVLGGLGFRGLALRQGVGFVKFRGVGFGVP